MTREELIAALDELLSESMESVVERERTTFDKMATPHGEQMVLFGTGRLGRKTLKGLRQLGIEPLAFCDNNASLWGKEVEGLRVLSPEEAVREFGKSASFVVTIWSDKIGHPLEEVRRQLSALGQVKVISFLPLYWKHATTFLPYFSLDLPSLITAGRSDILRCASLIADEKSRLLFFQNIKSRFLAQLEILPGAIQSSLQFTPEFITPNSEEIFLDAGAYNGDTVKLLLDSPNFSFREIIALEPDPVNFEDLNRFVGTLESGVQNRIRTMPVALSNRDGIITFASSGTEQAQISSSGGMTVSCGKIDTLFEKEAVSLIKMDIEGAEPDALEGSSEVIERLAPILAISAYHHISHLWSLALLIHKLNSGYAIFLRPHAAGGWDLILYAVPPHRLHV
jgi:FkbM family methyltransferase